MKKIVLFIFLIMIVPILASCNSDKYKAERNKIKGIDLENYLTTVNNGEYIETIYNSENTMSIYHLYEYENRYELIKVESFISLELLKDLDKVSTTTSTTTNVL
ncbi:MAG: hypothetical protein IJA65_02675, partial [Acholeplasmatales bacterium]|nr:hypothetical protein [Acholeplasmatales bacterium]